ncbi:MAG: carbohydrate kinase, partial [Gammaproteobacteria bacterium]
SSGGGAKNPAWQEIRQRVLGTPVHRARHADAAYGAALIARRGYRRQT